MFEGLIHVLVLLVSSQKVANCLSGIYAFDSQRTSSSGTANSADPSLFDFGIDYGAQNIDYNGQGKGVNVNLVKAFGGAVGARLSTTRFIQYAKITVKMSAIKVPGAITTFITMSPRKDEIDWEFVGGKSSSVESNIFYKGISEFGIRSQTHQTALIDQLQSYTIDWKSDTISWLIDGILVRTYSKDEALAKTLMTPFGERSYPSEASQIQFGVWDAGSSSSPGTSSWAGGAIPWPQGKTHYSATYESLEIQCYDDKNMPVPQWPAGDLTLNGKMAIITLNSTLNSILNSHHNFTSATSSSPTALSTSPALINEELAQIQTEMQPIIQKTISTITLHQPKTAGFGIAAVEDLQTQTATSFATIVSKSNILLTLLLCLY